MSVWTWSSIAVSMKNGPLRGRGLGCVHHAFNEGLRGFRVDGVAVGAQASHSGGSPMSQRECAGFNWPPLSIPAEEPVSICPEAVSRAGWSGWGLQGSIASRHCPLICPCAAGEVLPTRGVGQPASRTISFSGRALCVSSLPGLFAPLWSRACGVGHPVEPVSNVRSTDARRRERDCPEGVIHGFHVSLYKVDPRPCVSACNLLSNDDCRLALFDEVMERWPQVPLVIKPSSFACRAERLARTGTSPNRSVVAPSGRPEGMGPNANACEEMALCESA